MLIQEPFRAIYVEGRAVWNSFVFGPHTAMVTIVLGIGTAFAEPETIEIPEEKKDDVTAELVAGVKAYLDGNIAEAKSTLEFAVQLISELKAKGLSAFLPAAISEEWTREEADTQAVSAGHVRWRHQRVGEI